MVGNLLVYAEFVLLRHQCFVRCTLLGNATAPISQHVLQGHPPMSAHLVELDFALVEQTCQRRPGDAEYPCSLAGGEFPSDFADDHAVSAIKDSTDLPQQIN